jgi:hypothetical protein
MEGGIFSEDALHVVEGPQGTSLAPASFVGDDVKPVVKMLGERGGFASCGSGAFGACRVNVTRHDVKWQGMGCDGSCKGNYKSNKN